MNTTSTLPKKRCALIPEIRDEICDHPLGFQWSGSMPCTGSKQCPMCGTYRESQDTELETANTLSPLGTLAAEYLQQRKANMI